MHKPLLQALLLLTSVLALHTDPSARQILEVIAGMSAEMPLHLVAEGVEDGATFQALHELGIQYFQGYLFSNPLPVTELAACYGAALAAGT